MSPLFHQATAGQAGRAGAGAGAIVLEGGIAVEIDLPSEQLGALRPAGRAAAGVVDDLLRKIDRADDVLRAAAVQRVVEGVIGAAAILIERDAGQGTRGRRAVRVTIAPPSILVVAQACMGLLVVRMIVVPLVAVRLDPPAIDKSPRSMMKVPGPSVSDELPTRVRPLQKT